MYKKTGETWTKSPEVAFYKADYSRKLENYEIGNWKLTKPGPHSLLPPTIELC